MIDAVVATASGLQQVLSFPTILFMLGGVFAGYLVGLLPGLGGPTALALALPLAAGIETVDALALLVGLTAVTATSGDLTSILLGVPGEATSTAVMVEGHALTRRGEGGRAAGASVAAALLGAVFSACVLAVAVPVVRPFFGYAQSPELAMLALLGIYLIVPLSGAAPLKGVIAGGLGLLISTVGLDPQSGAPRLTFGRLFLWDGIGIATVSLAMYAIPEAIALARSDRGRAGVEAPVGALAGMREAWQHVGLVLRSSALGSAIGLLPGVGASVAQWIAYTHGTRHTPRDHLGTGVIEGVIAPAAASSATLGGALVPTLALGIPGSVSTALILGALGVKGIAPGAWFLTPEREGGHLSIVFALAWIIILSNVIAAIIGLLCLDRLARLARLSPSTLFPIVVSLVMLGVFAEKRAFGDLGVLAVLGLLGWAMAKHSWPRAPLLLGVVLGPLFERRVLLSTSLYGWRWVMRPGVLLLMAVLFVTVATLLRRSPRASSLPGTTRSGDLALGSGLVAVLAIAAWASHDLEGPGAAMPRLLTAGLCTLLLIHLAAAARSRGLPSQPRDDGAGTRRFGPIGWVALFILSASLVGFAGGTVVSSVAYSRLGASESWTKSLLIAMVLTLFVCTLLMLGLGGTGLVRGLR
jgi:putative tricarboxylic transport membrane protein